LKQSGEDRAESPKVSPQAIEAILKSLSMSDKGSDNSDKLDGGVAAGNKQQPQLEESSDEEEESSDEEEELNKEMKSPSVTTC